MTREEATEFIVQSVKSDIDMAKVADAIKALEQEPTTKNKLADDKTFYEQMVEYCNEHFLVLVEKDVWKDAEKALTTKNDLGVDTNKLLETCEKMSFDFELFGRPTKALLLDVVKNIVNDLLTVTPQETRKGHWEHGKELCKEYRGRILVDVTYADWHCSNCNYVIKGTVKPKWNYCPNCGSDNREVEE